MKNKFKIQNGKLIISRTFNSQLSTLNLKAGQALITLLIFMVVAITLTAGAIAILINNTLSTSKIEQTQLAYATAESGAENAILRLLRNPNYTGETLSINGGTATIQITGTEPKVITSVGTVGNFIRTLEIRVGYTNNILTVSSWKEIH